MPPQESKTDAVRALVRAIFKKIERLRRRAETQKQWAEICCLEAIAIRVRELEALGERILSAVIRGKAPDAGDPLEIPDFLRRY